MSNYNGIIIHTEQMDLTLAQLKEMYDSNDIETNPEYQRNYVYDEKRASSLIESILIGIPIPAVYLCEENDGVYSVIDGQQRITSFVKYLKNEYGLKGLTELKDLEGKLFKDLDKSIQRKLKAKSLRAISLNKDSQDLKYEIFSRLNQGAVSLKPQELRNCLYRGTFNDMLHDIAKSNTNLKELFHDKNSRQNYEERILRFFTLRDISFLKMTYVNAMNNYMKNHCNIAANELQKKKSMFNSLIDIVIQILGEDAFFSNKDRKKFNGAVYDSIMIPFSYFDKHLLMSHADEIREAIKCIKRDDKDYKQSIYVGTNAGRKVIERISKVYSLLHKIIDGSNVEKSNRCFSKEDKKKLFKKGCICNYCGNEILNIDDCEVDHIIPFSQGGPTNINNAQLLHRYCNRVKYDKVEW